MAASSHNPYPRSPNPSTRSYDSTSSVSSATSPKPPTQYMGGLMGTSARSAAPPQPIGIPPLPSIHHHHHSHPPHQPLPPHQIPFQPYTPVTATSAMGRDSLPSNESASSTPGIPHSQLPSGGMAGQKRAYRQRRKDPSCDACRERKVKCDATETTSCSECSSRNVKCQFTKETNRRMSSIKQVQDLEKQIERERRENRSLRRLLGETEGESGAGLDLEGLERMVQIPLNLPEIGSVPKPRLRPGPISELTRARSNMRTFSKGIWKSPALYRHAPAQTVFDPPRPELPPRAATDKLLQSYYTSVHVMMPMLHWPIFTRMVDDLYKPGGLQSASPAFLSMFFAVLAVGCLFSSEQHRSYQSAELAEISRKLVDPWNNDFVLDNVRTFLLIAVLLNEMNLKSAAWSSLGNAVRAAQELGLHTEIGPWNFLEGEMRRRVWWSVYIMDRSLAVELARPGMIDDADCDVSLPAAVDDHYIHDGHMLVPHGLEPLTQSLLAIIHVVRSYPHLNQALSTPVIAKTRLATFDRHFNACMRTFPHACDPSSDVGLLPHLLNPLIYLLHARLILHRHNLSPSCPPDARQSAIEQCSYTAVETARILVRTTPELADGATALLVTHVFRCALFLLLAGHIDHAGTCVGALAAIGARRDVAVPCGRYLAFFATVLASKRSEYATFLAKSTAPTPGLQQFGPPSRPVSGAAIQDALLHDEELLVYVSADLQAAPDVAWVWAGGERGAGESPRQAPSASLAGPAAGSALFSAEVRTGLSDEEARDWGGWERVETLVRGLGGGVPRTPPPPPPGQAWGTPLRPGGAADAGPSSAVSGEGGSTGNSPTAKSKSQDRISIANII